MGSSGFVSKSVSKENRKDGLRKQRVRDKKKANKSIEL